MTTHSTVARTIAELVRDRYVFAEVGERLHAFLTKQAQSGVYDEMSAEEFASRVTSELRSTSGDRHLRLRFSAEPHIQQNAEETVREQNDRAGHCRQIGYGVDDPERSSNGVGILKIRELVEPTLSQKAYETALLSIADAKALVIDLRECVGGDPSTVALVCSHLFDAPTQLSTIAPRNAPAEPYWTDPDAYPVRFGGGKPLAIAVANFTFSGAEMLAYDLQSLGRATIVGTTTGGGAHACAFHWPTSHFSLLLPEARPVNPITGANWEGCGVVPDVSCSERDALQVAINHVQHQICVA